MGSLVVVWFLTLGLHSRRNLQQLLINVNVLVSFVLFFLSDASELHSPTKNIRNVVEGRAAVGFGL